MVRWLRKRSAWGDQTQLQSVKHSTTKNQTTRTLLEAAVVEQRLDSAPMPVWLRQLSDSKSSNSARKRNKLNTKLHGRTLRPPWRTSALTVRHCCDATAMSRGAVPIWSGCDTCKLAPALVACAHSTLSTSTEWLRTAQYTAVRPLQALVADLVQAPGVEHCHLLLRGRCSFITGLATSVLSIEYCKLYASLTFGPRRVSAVGNVGGMLGGDCARQCPLAGTHPLSTTFQSKPGSSRPLLRTQLSSLARCGPFGDRQVTSSVPQRRDSWGWLSGMPDMM